MKRIILKESEIRQYVRSLIRESLENEGRASQKTIDYWLNATPESLKDAQPRNGQDPAVFQQLKNMVMGLPYNRGALGQAGKDIEDAWRKSRGLESFKTSKGGRGLGVREVNADGNDAQQPKSEQQKAIDAELQRLKKNAQERERQRAIYNPIKQANKAKREEINNREFETTRADFELWCEKNHLNPKDNKAFETFNALRKNEKDQEFQDWCSNNGVNPNDENAMDLFNKDQDEKQKQWYYEHGLDVPSKDSTVRRIAYLQNRISELQKSSDTHDKKELAACEKALKYAKRTLNSYNPKKYKGVKVSSQEEQVPDEENVDNISDEPLDWEMVDPEEDEVINGMDDENAAISAMDDMSFDENEFKAWCQEQGYDANNPQIKDWYNKMKADGMLSNIYNSRQQAQNNSENDNEDDFDEEEIEEPMYDDDGISGRSMRNFLGHLDSIYDDDDDGHFYRNEDDTDEDRYDDEDFYDR